MNQKLAEIQLLLNAMFVDFPGRDIFFIRQSYYRQIILRLCSSAKTVLTQGVSGLWLYRIFTCFGETLDTVLNLIPFSTVFSADKNILLSLQFQWAP